MAASPMAKRARFRTFHPIAMTIRILIEASSRKSTLSHERCHKAEERHAGHEISRSVQWIDNDSQFGLIEAIQETGSFDALPSPTNSASGIILSISWLGSFVRGRDQIGRVRLRPHVEIPHLLNQGRISRQAA
jgi:hypothetical protein